MRPAGWFTIVLLAGAKVEINPETCKHFRDFFYNYFQLPSFLSSINKKMETKAPGLAAQGFQKVLLFMKNSESGGNAGALNFPS